MTDFNRVLFVSYPFPPVGGAGVQRTTKFVKYLPEFGWAPSVLTAANPSVPVLDPTLSADIPRETIVVRTHTLEPEYAVKRAVAAPSGTAAGAVRLSGSPLVKNLLRRVATAVLQPDPQILWNRSAVRQGAWLLGAVPHAAIVATGPPFSSFLVGHALSRRSGVPLVVDYRDEWTISHEYLEHKQVGRLARGIQARMQARVLRQAAAVVATTRHSARALEAVGRLAGCDAGFSTIYNGFDATDFSSPLARPSPGRFRLVYVGTLWNLTSIQPVVEAIRVVGESRPDLLGRLELVVAGRRTSAQQDAISALAGLPVRLVEHEYVDHQAAVALMRSADALLLLLSSVPGAERVVPAKLFEYMAARRPILAVAPPGETCDLVAECRAGTTFNPAQVNELAQHLMALLALHPDPAEQTASADSSQFDRRSQARQLATLLESVRVGANERH